MAKKSGWHGSGAFTKSESLSGSKGMCSERMPMSQGKMSSKQVVSHQPGKAYSLEHAGDRVGGETRTFSAGIPGEAGKK